MRRKIFIRCSKFRIGLSHHGNFANYFSFFLILLFFIFHTFFSTIGGTCSHLTFIFLLLLVSFFRRIAILASVAITISKLFHKRIIFVAIDTKIFTFIFWSI